MYFARCSHYCVPPTEHVVHPTGQPLQQALRCLARVWLLAGAEEQNLVDADLKYKTMTIIFTPLIWPFISENKYEQI